MRRYRPRSIQHFSLPILALFTLLSALFPARAAAQVAPLDLSAVGPGPVTVERRENAVLIRWPDERARQWTAEFSLDPARPLVTSIGVAGRTVLERARPLYWCTTGKRRGGWDEFFDRPWTHPDGFRTFSGVFRLRSANVRTIGDRVVIHFDGLKLGIFEGGIAFTFFPGSRLIQQEAVAATTEPDTAYFYDAGIRMAAESERIAGWNMESEATYYNSDGKIVVERPDFERTPVKAKYRMISLRTAGGSLVAFPPPHQYFFARDTTQNLGYLWHSSYRGETAIGIRQLPDDNLPFYPWMNAPPQTQQRMSIFYLISDGAPAEALEQTLRYTNRDRFPSLPGYKKLASHWHLAYSVQAMKRVAQGQGQGFQWTPPFKPVLKEMGIDAAMIMDFHGDGHPQSLAEERVKELEAYYRGSRAQSDRDFLIIPSEEANVYLGGHWAVTFPKPVYWFMKRPADKAFLTEDPKYGRVYHVGNEQEMFDLIRRENGWMYQTHPRTKGSKGYPDKIRDRDYFRDPRYFGAGWKAMPTDLSSLRAGVRALDLMDDMNNWGMAKRLMGETDLFQIDSTHELYAHMNVNYVRLASLPDFDNYGLMIDALNRGDFFISTGEVLLPKVEIDRNSADRITARAEVKWTFPLQFAEVVWGDGKQTQRKIFPLETTREFGSANFQWELEAAGWKWARVAVWDIAGNGAFINPIWRVRPDVTN
jgi:hypothetical protein